MPTGLLYFFYRGPDQIHADSNGCAAGNTLQEAIVQGFLELVERDAYAIWWYNRLHRPGVDLDQFDDSYVRDLRAQLAEAGRRLWVLDVTNDLGDSVFRRDIALDARMAQENIEFGSGAHFDTRIALLRALTELNQFLSIGLMGGGTGEKSSLDGSTPLRLQNYPFLTPSGAATVKPGLGPRSAPRQHARSGEACVNVAKRQGLDFLVLDQTRPDIEVPVARVIVPGLRHFYLRLAPGRLYDVPVKLGWRDRPMPEGRAYAVPPPYLRSAGLRAPGTKRGQRLPTAVLCARLGGHVRLETHAGGTILPRFQDHSVDLGTFSTDAAHRAQELRAGLPFTSFASGRRQADKEIASLIQRLARYGLVEYPIRASPSPRGPRRRRAAGSRYWPRMSPLRDSDLWRCLGLPTCDAAATRWSWNCRAPVRCSGFATRRSVPP